jgi:hypothetical protein
LWQYLKADLKWAAFKPLAQLQTKDHRLNKTANCTGEFSQSIANWMGISRNPPLPSCRSYLIPVPKVEQLLALSTPEVIASITGYEFILMPYLP